MHGCTACGDTGYIKCRQWVPFVTMFAGTWIPQIPTAGYWYDYYMPCFCRTIGRLPISSLEETDHAAG